MSYSNYLITYWYPLIWHHSYDLKLSHKYIEWVIVYNTGCCIVEISTHEYTLITRVHVMSTHWFHWHKSALFIPMKSLLNYQASHFCMGIGHLYFYCSVITVAMFASLKDAKLAPQQQEEVKPHYHNARGGYHHHYHHHHHHHRGRQRHHHNE